MTYLAIETLANYKSCRGPVLLEATHDAFLILVSMLLQWKPHASFPYLRHHYAQEVLYFGWP